MKKIELSYEESIDSLTFQVKDLNSWINEKLKETINSIPKNISNESKLLIAKYASLTIKSITLFKKLYKKEEELDELNWVVREVIISFKYDVKHSLESN